MTRPTSARSSVLAAGGGERGAADVVVELEVGSSIHTGGPSAERREPDPLPVTRDEVKL